MGTKDQKKKDMVNANEKKWTPALMKSGWTVLPSIILEKQAALGLDPVDINIILQIAKHWWHSDNLPFPSKKSIADSIGRSEDTVRRHIAAMEKVGFIKREKRFDGKGGQKSNIYTFEGLIEAAKPFAKESQKLKAEAQQKNDNRKKRKKPVLDQE